MDLWKAMEKALAHAERLSQEGDWLKLYGSHEEVVNRKVKFLSDYMGSDPKPWRW